MFGEVQAASKQKKATGSDGIPSEMVKAGCFILQIALLSLMKRIAKSRMLSSELEISEIITLYKKGVRSDCATYRLINLLSCMYKLLMQSLYKKLSTNLIKAL